MRKVFLIRGTVVLLVVGLIYGLSRLGGYMWGNVRVRFYGRVVDQDGRGVPGVPVTAGVTADNLVQVPLPMAGPLRSHRVLKTTTDADGNFEVDGGRGISVAIEEFHLAGYVQQGPDRRRDFYREPHSSQSEAERTLGDSPATRVTFPVWRKGPTERLVSESITCKGGGWDGRPFVVDLLRRQARQDPAGPGDLRVAISCAVDPRQAGQQPFDWTFAIEAVDGGVVETADPFPYQAAETGYRGRYEHAVRADGSTGRWADEVQRRYYLRSRGGQVYAALTVAARPTYDVGPVIQIKYVANPSGSRNLEPDPLKRVHVP